MGIGDKSAGDPAYRRLSRRFTLAVAGAQTAYWIYTFRLIAVNANPMGDGMEFAAIVPFGLVFIALVAPALALGIWGRMLPLGVLLAVAGLIANGLLFLEISSELTGGGTRPLRL
jgi:hypothetical protein